MDLHVEEIAIAGGNDEDIEAVILMNILGDEGENNNGNGLQEFNLDEISPDECKFLFRFEQDDLYRLVQALHRPEVIRTYKGNKISGITGLCMVLRRLAYPNRSRDLNMFRSSPQSMSLLINRVVEVINQNHGHLLSGLTQLSWLTQRRLEIYAQAVREKGGAIPNCWGFIDGTTRAICKPSVDQENYYSGHKRVHCVKYQSVLCPDGIIANLKGGWPGRRHDAAMFAESNLYAELERVAVFPNRNYVLYGDQAYGVRELLLAPYRQNIGLQEHHHQFNQSMKLLRIAVEWGFQKIEVEAMYKVGTLLTNCHTCLYGSQTAQYFNINPLQLEEYIGE